MEWKSKKLSGAALEASRESRVAVFAGSFDPFTVGHFDLVKRAAGMFDSLIVVVAQNANKKNMFDAETRKALVEAAVSEIPNVKVAVHGGLTVDFMKSVGARYLLRGIRNASDLDAEQAVAWNNKVLFDDVETVLLLSAQEHLVVSSSLVRELHQPDNARFPVNGFVNVKGFCFRRARLPLSAVLDGQISNFLRF